MQNLALKRLTRILGLIQFTGALTPSQITANQNDYNPAGLRAANVLRLSSDASRDITGIFTANQSGRMLMVFNVGSQNIVLKNASASSTADYRFAIGADITIQPNHGVTLIYDSTSLRWRCSGVG